ncbi:hypothetical protein AC578_3443 [Pseudocercospora eumusae]|uniref:Transcription factor Opi1 n=1 Tax=Pseudocercospora eumusae TaxID=321146 RepID=A0A139HR56_9PEZI|nr:hypothetical protein AC578_3443 [Pseudocercospora eumusae]
MEVTQERPPTLASRSPETVEWPTVPRHEPIPQANDITLPDLKTVLSPDFERMSSPQTSNHPASPTSVRSLPRIDPGHALTNGVHRGATDVSMASSVETGSVMSMEDRTARSTSVSMEDPDVRLAAEALSGLGNPSLMHGSGGQSTHMSNGIRLSDEPEPLLELIAQAHPWVGGTIKTSLAAYSTTKYYSPRFVRNSAGFVERNVGMPLVNTVNAVGEKTGLDNQVRRYLDARRPGDVEQGRDGKGDAALENGDLTRARQEEQLPPYGSSRPPSYREEASPVGQGRYSHEMKMQVRPANGRSWSSQLFVTTSGLSVALSNASRNSLKLCLRLLQDSALHVQNLMEALSSILREYETTREQQYRNDNASLEKGQRPATPERSEDARRLAEHMKRTCDDIWQRLRQVSEAVSTYAGGALPENAREFVRSQLMSLPQRWRVVSDQQYAESETSRNARRMIHFAAEGLDMMSQVSGVLQATLNSAEQWLARVGRSDQDDQMRDTPSTHDRSETEKS